MDSDASRLRLEDFVRSVWEGVELPGTAPDYHFLLQGAVTQLWSRRRREPTRADEFVNAVYVALGGQYYDDELHTSDPEAVDCYREIARLAARGIYYLQIAEATGQRPEPSQFGIKEYEWNWVGGIDRGWPVFERAIDQAIGGFPG